MATLKVSAYPWRSSPPVVGKRTYVIDPDGNTVAMLPVITEAPDTLARRSADALVIASAPEMLATLRELVAAGSTGGDGDRKLPERGYFRTDTLGAVFERAVAVLRDLGEVE